ETALDLYGFFNYQELEFFDILNDVRGIGPKAALELSSLGPLENIKERILNQDEKLFSSIPGIGQKKAMSIILELTGKIKNIPKEKSSRGDEVTDALLGLGFSKQRIKEILSKIPQDVINPQEKIKASLKIMGK
ncbi:Holliday junction branch migration protein RuvA, partial [Patescibacteria group bacterium]|nr:Holliday junction branch migration protein RuvA [Patescibacteria group bacterium]